MKTDKPLRRPHIIRDVGVMLSLISIIGICGCWAPFRSPAIPACELSDEFRTPIRTGGPPLNFSMLTINQPADYLLGANDILTVTIPELTDGQLPQTISATVMSDGNIHLPMAGSIQVGGLNLIDAQKRINDRYADGILKEPQVTIALQTKATIGVLVLGQVNQPGVHYLPRYENDVGHAVAAAGGITADAADVIEVHRKASAEQLPPQGSNPRHSPIHQVRFDAPDFDSSTNYPWSSQTRLSTSDPDPTNFNDAIMNHGAPKRAARSREFRPTYDPYFKSTVTQNAFQATELPVAPAGALARFAPSANPDHTPEMRMIRTPLVDRDQMGPSRTEVDLSESRAGRQAVHLQNIVRGDSNLIQWGQNHGSPIDPGVLGQGSWAAIERIPMRGPGARDLTEDQIVLQPGDVVVVPNRKHEVFYVVGRLSQTNTVRFTVGDRERELGVGFVLPRDREIDVVTAVAMAGYIDPIDSPTTVTVQRAMPEGTPLLIHVNLIAARYDPQQTVLVQPGDIIYLNPDAAWWWRRTIDRIVPDLLLEPYFKAIGR